MRQILGAADLTKVAATKSDAEPKGEHAAYGKSLKPKEIDSMVVDIKNLQ